MRHYLPILLAAILFVSCASAPTPRTDGPVGGDPVFRFQTGDAFSVDFSERLMHMPRDGAEPASKRSTFVNFTLSVLEVTVDGVAHLHFAPTKSRFTIEEGDRPAIVRSGYVERGRDRFDLSVGVRYLRNIDDHGLHVVVDPEGHWRRDFRGGPPPADFLHCETWREVPEGLTTYPRPETKRSRPALLETYVPTDWRRQKNWRFPFEFAPHPPMTGLMPVEFTVRLTRREGSLLFLEGAVAGAGKEKAKSPFGLVLLGDVTLGLRFKRAVYSARFDLDLGLPIEARQEIHWTTQRYVDGLGEVISDDSQILTFRVRKISD